MSHPSWVCGLKRARQGRQRGTQQVTPFVGVWIETMSGSLAEKAYYVTPFVGVWIETL